MTAIQGLSNEAARGINLIYFLPTSIGALFSHIKNKMIDKRAFIFTALSGVIAAAATAFLSKYFSSELLKKLFGGFLIIIGIREFFRNED